MCPKCKKQFVIKKAVTRTVDALVAQTTIVGTKHKNDDGSSRHKALKKCKAGDLLLLLREKWNQYDPNAIAVYSMEVTESTGQLGYIPADDAKDIAPLMDSGEVLTATLRYIDYDENTSGEKVWMTDVEITCKAEIKEGQP
jgi:hypothetical protein